jgi:hypothetical protein
VCSLRLSLTEISWFLMLLTQTFPSCIRRMYFGSALAPPCGEPLPYFPGYVSWHAPVPSTGRKQILICCLPGRAYNLLVAPADKEFSWGTPPHPKVLRPSARTLSCNSTETKQTRLASQSRVGMGRGFSDKVGIDLLARCRKPQ